MNLRYFWQALKCAFGWHDYTSAPVHIPLLWDCLQNYKGSSQLECRFCEWKGECITSRFEGKGLIFKEATNEKP